MDNEIYAFSSALTIQYKIQKNPEANKIVFDVANPNEAMIELCDDEKFNEFVELCTEKIKAFLDFSPEDITSLV